MTIKKLNPCYCCMSRNISCHIDCNKYKAYKIILEQVKKKKKFVDNLSKMKERSYL